MNTASRQYNTELNPHGCGSVLDLPGNNWRVGSIPAYQDAAGSLFTSYDYDAFGHPSGSPISNYGYTGEQTDPQTGLIYLRAIYYDPDLGRFISADPYWGRLKEPISQNRFIYVHNNPISNVDPSGLNGIVAEIIIGTAIVLAVIGAYKFQDAVKEATGQATEVKKSEERDLDNIDALINGGIIPYPGNDSNKELRILTNDLMNVIKNAPPGTSITEPVSNPFNKFHATGIVVQEAIKACP